MPEKVWFITGASRGFGRIWAEAALDRGDKVAASARDVATLADLEARFGDAVLPLALDVTDPDRPRQAIEQAHAHFGRLDVVLNNAGYSLVGTIEEAEEADVKAMFETNVYGTLRVIKAALPLLRQQGHGHIMGVSSGLGLVTLPLIGYYGASKWTFEAIHESLATEVAPFGVKVTIVEPGAYATEFGSPQSLRFATTMEIYDDLRNAMMTRMTSMERADPHATPEAIFKAADAEHPPLRLILGKDNLPWIRAAYAERLALWEAWADVSNAAKGEPQKPA